MVWLGILLAIGTSVSWSFGNVLTQRLGKQIGAPRGTLWAMATGAVLAAPCALLFDARSAPTDAAVAGWIGLAAVAGLFAYIGLYVAFANEGLTVGVPIVTSWSLVAGAFSVGLLGETLRGTQLGGAVAVLAGVIAVAIPRRPAGERETSGSSQGSRRALRAAFASAAGFGVMIPAMGRMAPATGAFGAIVVVFASGIVLGLVISRVAKVSLAPPPRRLWPLVLATAAAETTGFVTVTLARKFAPMAIVAPVASLATVFTLLYAWLIAKERPSVLAAGGALVAAAGVVVLSL